MANYTAQEVQTAVENIVRSMVRNTTGSLGERKVLTSFSDLQEAAAGVFLLYYNAPFYVIKLGTTRLLDAAQTQAQTVAELIDAIQVLGRIVTPVEDVSSLANAKAALQELEAAVSTRTTPFANMENVPAFRRYAQSLNQFVSAYGANVKGATLDPAKVGVSTSTGSQEALATAEAYAEAQSSGSDQEGGQDVAGAQSSVSGCALGVDGVVTSLGIVDTPRGARSRIPALVTQLKSQHEELIRRARLLVGALDDFRGMNLPKAAAEGVISRSREVLAGHLDTLEGQSAEERLTGLRALVLDILTQLPLVAKYGAMNAPGEYLTTSGVAAAFTDATHPGTPAALESDLYGPYCITEENQFLRLYLDGNAAPVDYPLPQGFVATVTGTVGAPFVVTTGVNDSLLLEHGNPDTSMAQYNVTLEPGIWTAQEIAQQVNTALSGSPLQCRAIFAPTKYHSSMLVVSLGGNLARFVVMAGSLTGLGVSVGDEVDILSGPNAGMTLAITAVGDEGASFDAEGEAPITTAGLPDGAEVQVGGASRMIELYDAEDEVSMALRRAIRVPLGSSVQNAASQNLGLYAGSSVRSRPVDAKNLADGIAKSSTQLTASAAFVATHYVGTARASDTDSTVVVLSQGRYEVVATSTDSFGVYTLTAAEPYTLVGLDNRVVIRGCSNSQYINADGVVTARTADNRTLTVAFPTDMGDLGSIEIEIGPDINFHFGDVLNIVDGPNAGRYTLREAKYVGTTCSIEVVLDSALPVPKVDAEPIEFNVTFGQERVVFSSRDKSLNSRIGCDSVSGSTGAGLFFNDWPLSAVGTTSWLRFANYPVGASLGDSVLLFLTDHATPSSTHAVVGLEQGSRLLQVYPGLAPALVTSFSMNHAVPFGRVRTQKVANYGDMQTRLARWLNRTSQQDLFFKNMPTYLNPVLGAPRPPAAAVNDAVSYVRQLLTWLTCNGANFSAGNATDTLEYALASYTAAAEEPVDTLLGTFRSRGADRAIDFLLEGRFSEFFGLTVDTVSYSGALTSSIREVAREDLVVRKVDRGKATQRVLSSSVPQEDPEYPSR